MFQPRLVLKKIQSLVPSKRIHLFKSGIKGSVPSEQDPTLLRFQTMKRPKEFSAPRKQEHATASTNVIQGNKDPSQIGSQTWKY